MNLEYDPELPELPPAEVRNLHRDFIFRDHAVIRALWRNRSDVAPGVMRSNQPSPAQIRRLRDDGVVAILNLRGLNPGNSFYYLENRACHENGILLLSLDFYPSGLPGKETLRKFREFFVQATGPVLFHCKSGADRTGFAAALYQLMFSQNDVEKARAELHWKFLHIRSRRMGLFDFAIDQFARAHARTGLSVMEWVECQYEPAAIGRDYAAYLKRR